jgi:hypothetical protein
MSLWPILLAWVAVQDETVKRPASAKEILPAKNGDLLVLKLDRSKQVGIVDVKQKKLVKIIKVTSADYRFAAGGTGRRARRWPVRRSPERPPTNSAATRPSSSCASRRRPRTRPT